MPAVLDWREVVLRLVLTVAAGAIIGANRGEQGQPAGLRTTVLVCVAASASMIQVNLLLVLAAQKQSLVTLDLMRLPLGILSGMGFIGAGAILRRGDAVRGITTAATLWFVTVMGLCFGGGQIVLGLELLVLAMVVLWGMKWLERSFFEDKRATLLLTMTAAGPDETELRARLAAERFDVSRYAVSQTRGDGRRRMEIDVRWRPRGTQGHTPAIVGELVRTAGVTRVKWDPK